MVDAPFDEAFVLTDKAELGLGSYCAGSTPVSPIDQLAREGALFTN